ncbi:major histocompatibility complex class I-related gene protein-like [Thamnophis elegans]|uniref:major histocompatibility complex class I-related gene protein-like n=1 Tax=Thamnophis elegans TaxID=35005 RepID=UPI001376AC08|nr:major histocompatibility complex class I-related gene protein-like [Thamnophis elegans]
MELPRAPLWLLWAVLESSVPGSRCGSSRHSLCNSYLKVSESSQGLPEFLSMVHLDDQPITQYDNNTMKMVPWLEMVDTTILVALERVFRADLEWLSKLNHKAGGLHTWQVSLGCEVREDGSKGGFLHYGYNGMDFISFDKETLRWVTAQPQAQKVKEKWEDDTRRSQRNIIYLEETCINMMQEYLPYQKEALLQTEPPEGKVTRKVVDDSLEVLICQAFGFYPKEIQTTWMRDGEVCQYETLHKNVAPNSDGTYYVQLSIEIDPKERDHFQCYLEHEGLRKPLVLALKEEKRERRSDYDVPHFDEPLFLSVGTVIVIIFGAVTLCLIVGFGLNYRKKHHQARKTCLDHLLEKLCSSPTDGAEDEIQSQVMFPPKMTSKGCCGEKTELGGEETSLKASPDAYSNNKESCGDFTVQEPLKDADAPKPGMERMEEEVSPGT